MDDPGGCRRDEGGDGAVDVVVSEVKVGDGAEGGGAKGEEVDALFGEGGGDVVCAPPPEGGDVGHVCFDRVEFD